MSFKIKRLYVYALLLVTLGSISLAGIVYFESKTDKSKETSVAIKEFLCDNSFNENESASILLKKANRKVEISNISSAEVEGAARINKDVVGWIKVPDTRINYPIVKGKDNDFYLHHDIYRQESVYGTIFMDYRNSMEKLDPNTSLFGHHMKDGSMFRDLILYKDKDFFDTHRFIYTRSLDKEETWEVFSAYVTDTNFYFIQNSFESDKEYESFIDKLMKKSKFKTDTKVTKEDKILTLCTCTYEFNDARFVVQAKKID